MRFAQPLIPGTRLDLLLLGPRGACYVEVKNVTARPDDGAAAFPDAVTERGLKHLHALIRLARAGPPGDPAAGVAARAPLRRRQRRNDEHRVAWSGPSDPRYFRSFQAGMG
jgi:hypothetical protein